MKKKIISKLNLKISLGIFVSIFLFTTVSFAQISVPNYFQIFKSTDKPIRNMVVKNIGKSPLLVNTIVNESVINDDGKEVTKTSKGLIVAPKNFALGAGEQKNIRLYVAKSKDNMEKFYKITFSPKPLSSENEYKNFSEGEKSIGIRIVTGMIATVFVEPKEREIDIEVKRNETSVVFKNKGNYHTRIFKAFACDKDLLDKNCKKVEKFFTLRPKQTKEITLGKNQYLFYNEKQVAGGKVLNKKVAPL
jgi:P pilus assembly chaperone PapD